jgi:hypothetical protein
MSVRLLLNIIILLFLIKSQSTKSSMYKSSTVWNKKKTNKTMCDCFKGDGSIDVRVNRSTKLLQLSHSFYWIVC